MQTDFGLTISYNGKYNFYIELWNFYAGLISGNSWGPYGCDAAFTEYMFETWQDGSLYTKFQKFSRRRDFFYCDEPAQIGAKGVKA